MRRFITKLLILSWAILPIGAINTAYAVPTTNQFLFSECQGAAASSAVCRERNTKQNPVLHAIKVAADLLALATGAAAVVMVILGGVTMIFSAGNTEAIASARKRIIYALVGLVVVALAWVIVSYTVDRLIK